MVDYKPAEEDQCREEEDNEAGSDHGVERHQEMGTLSLELAPGTVGHPVTHGVRPDTRCEAGAHVTTRVRSLRVTCQQRRLSGYRCELQPGEADLASALTSQLDSHTGGVTARGATVGRDG